VPPLAPTTASSTEKITATVSSLEHDAQAMLTSVGTVGVGVGEVTATTAALSDVARQQHELVERLDRSVGDAIKRMQSMGQVTEKLDRRESERLPASGFAEVRIGGTTFAAEMNDLSTTGARLSAQEILPVKTGDTLTVDLPLGSTDGVVVTAEVMRERREDGVHELGVRFVQTRSAEMARVAAYLATAASRIDQQAGVS
jgi:methyl-accepting chemotaxis protein